MKGINNKPRRTGKLLRLATMVLLATRLALAAIPEAATNYPASAISVSIIQIHNLNPLFLNSLLGRRCLTSHRRTTLPPARAT